MSVQESADINTRPFILMGLPLSLRVDDATIKKDTGRTAVLASNTLMGKLAVVSAITPVAGGTDTGNGTCTLATVNGINSLGEKVVPTIGTYLFTFTAALIGTLSDPSGNDLVTGIALNDGTTTVITYAGIQFTITDGSTAFISGDSFTLPVVADGDYTPYDPASVLGADKPAGIFDPEGSLGDITAAALVAADVLDVPILIFGAQYDSAQLVIENSGALTDIVPGANISVYDFLKQSSLVGTATIAGSAVENS